MSDNSDTVEVDQAYSTDAELSPAKIRWQCRRGMLELDLILLTFFDETYHTLATAQKKAFVQLLALPNPLLYQLLMAREVEEREGSKTSDETLILNEALEEVFNKCISRDYVQTNHVQTHLEIQNNLEVIEGLTRMLRAAAKWKK